MKQYYIYVQRTKAKTANSLSQALKMAHIMATDFVCDVTVSSENGVIGIVEAPYKTDRGTTVGARFKRL